MVTIRSPLLWTCNSFHLSQCLDKLNNDISVSRYYDRYDRCGLTASLKMEMGASQIGLYDVILTTPTCNANADQAKRKVVVQEAIDIHEQKIKKYKK